MLVRVRACAVCRTDLHVVDGELTDPKLPLIPVTRSSDVVEAVGAGVERSRRRPRRRPLARLDLRHVPVLPHRPGKPMRHARGSPATRSTAAIAEYTVADERFCFAAPRRYDDVEAAPLLCAGLIGYRALHAGDAPRASASTASARRRTSSPRWPRAGRRVFAFTRPGDTDGQEFAR